MLSSTGDTLLVVYFFDPKVSAQKNYLEYFIEFAREFHLARFVKVNCDLVDNNKAIEEMDIEELPKIMLTRNGKHVMTIAKQDFDSDCVKHLIEVNI